MLTYKNETKTVAKWALILGYTDGGSLLHWRIKTWGIKKAMSAQVPIPNLITYKGQTKSIPGWAKELNIPINKLRYRLRKYKQLGTDVALETPARHSESHGGTHWPEYRIWNAMCDRTHNPNHPQWEDYGGRGITLCDAWRYSFVQFITDVGRRPHKPNMTIERINNDEGYYPGNVKWATRKENQNNRRITKCLTRYR